MASEEVEFSVIVSCYEEERTIETFHRRLSATLGSLDLADCRLETKLRASGDVRGDAGAEAARGRERGLRRG